MRSGNLSAVSQGTQRRGVELLAAHGFHRMAKNHFNLSNLDRRYSLVPIQTAHVTQQLGELNLAVPSGSPVNAPALRASHKLQHQGDERELRRALQMSGARESRLPTRRFPVSSPHSPAGKRSQQS